MTLILFLAKKIQGTQVNLSVSLEKPDITIHRGTVSTQILEPSRRIPRIMLKILCFNGATNFSKYHWG